MHLVLVVHREVIHHIHGIDTGFFAARFTAATTQGPQGATGTAEVKVNFPQRVKTGLQVFRRGAKQNDVSGRTMHVVKSAAVLVPNIRQCTQLFAGVKEAGNLVYPHGMKLTRIRETLGIIGITADNAAAVTFDANNAAMFPVTDFFHVRCLNLLQQTLRQLACFCRFLDFRDKAGPITFFQFIQQWCRSYFLFHIHEPSLPF